MGSRIDALYEAAQNAAPEARCEDIGGEPHYRWDRKHLRDQAIEGPLADFMALADPQTVMALVEVYRAAVEARNVGALDSDEDWTRYSAKRGIRAAIEKVEAFDTPDARSEEAR